MTKKYKAGVKLTINERLIANVHAAIRIKRIYGKDRVIALSLISQMFKRGDLTYKQWEYLKVIFKKSKAGKVAKKPYQYLYAIGDGSKVKIGMSSNVNKRLSGLQSSNPKELKIIWKIKVGTSRVDAISNERKLHSLCRKYGVRGEWFDLDCIALVKSFTVQS